MLGEADGPFATAGRTQLESLAGEKAKVNMPAVRIRTADTRDALEIVATRRESLTELLDTLKAIPAVGGGVLLIVVLAEVGEVPLEDDVELIANTRNVLVPRRGRDRVCRAYTIVYKRNQPRASDRGAVHRSPHHMAHSPDAFSELSLRRGRRGCASLCVNRREQLACRPPLTVKFAVGTRSG